MLKMDAYTKYLQAHINDELIFRSVIPPGDSYYIRRCAREFAETLNNNYESLTPIHHFRLNQLSRQFEEILEDLEHSTYYILPSIVLFLKTIQESLLDIKYLFDGPNNSLSRVFVRPALRKYMMNDRAINLVLEALKKETNNTLFLQVVRTELVESKKSFLNAIKLHTGCYKEDLMASAWHPQRLQKWLDAGYSIEEITEF